MPTPRNRSTVNTYVKTALLADLEASREKVVEAVEQYDETLARWKETVVAKFKKAVEQYDPHSTEFGKSSWHENFEPPRLPDACRDYRVVNLNKAISRVVAQASDEHGNIKLYSHDPILTEYLAYASCL